MSFVQSDWNIMNYYAEEGLDRYIRNTFFNDWSKPPGIMVEVGAGETRSYSVSRHFRENGWRCICIEPNPNFVEAKLRFEHFKILGVSDGTNHFIIVSCFSKRDSNLI